jgi:hypothetical protein
LASSRGTSNGPDVQDVIHTILAFEAINQVRFSLVIGRVDNGKESCLQMTADAWPKEDVPGDHSPLASAKYVIGLSDRRTMDACIMQLMYKLDAVLAAGEFSKLMKQ